MRPILAKIPPTNKTKHLKNYESDPESDSEKKEERENEEIKFEND